MSRWTSPADIRAAVQREWDSGRLLRARIPQPRGAVEAPADDPGGGLRAVLADRGATPVPFRVKLRRPSGRSLADDFDGVREWAARIDSLPYGVVEHTDLRSRLLGSQSLPASVSFEAHAAMLALIGKTSADTRFRALLAKTPQRFLAAVAERPLSVLAAASDWEQIVAAAEWIRTHPHPGIYLRQADIPGVHTKVVESHRRLISALVEAAGYAGRAGHADGGHADGVGHAGGGHAAGGHAAGGHADAAGHAGQGDEAGQEDEADRARHADEAGHAGPGSSARTGGGRGWFERRYGFRTRPALVRLRQLDPLTAPLPGLTDITLTARELADLDPPVGHVFITENEINFLSFPAAPNALVIFGSGNEAPETLGQLPWLQTAGVHYWGDIDTHGFAILDRVRAQIPHTTSLLMDVDTLLAHRESWVREPSPTRRDLPRLTDSEAQTYSALLSGTYGENLRLEQEFVRFRVVQAAVADLCR